MYTYKMDMQNLIKLMEENNNIELDQSVSSNAQKCPLELKLTITPEFCKKADTIKARARAEKDHKIMDNMVSQPATEKCRSSNFSATSLTIGSWQKISRREGDLVGKFLYKKKKIVWEILDGDRKRKMEMLFSNIVAIKANIHDNEPGVLKIELKEPPDFAVQLPPQPRKHTVWQNAPDFTKKQALFCRRHVVTCPLGVLKKHYNILLHRNNDLLELSRKPFPIVEYPVFSITAAISLNISSQCNSCGGSPVVQRCYTCSHGSFEQQSQNVPPMQDFNPDDANFVSSVLNWNHIGYNQENTFMPQEQVVLSPPNVAASSLELFSETNHMDPLLEQSWITTCEDNIGLNQTKLVDDMLTDVAQPIMTMPCLQENPFDPGR